MLEYALFENPIAYVAEAQTITLFIGGDDIGDAALAVAEGAPIHIIESAIQSYATHTTRMLKSISRVSKAHVIVCTQYNPFPNTPAASTSIDALNMVTTRIATATGASVAPVHAWFAGNQAALIAGYRTGRIQDALRGVLPIHPNNEGHSVIANGLLPLFRRG